MLGALSRVQCPTCPRMFIAHHTRTRCHICSGERAKARELGTGAAAAYKAVKAAVQKGELPKASTLACTDCGKQARDYDHRDYGKPLAVEPVCRSCNKLRGPAIPAVTTQA